MNNNILVLGAGFLGTRLQEALKCKISDRKIYSYKDADAQIKKHKPKILINCIGNRGSNVDECEKELDKTITANTFVPFILAEAALRNKVRLVHISTGCIFHYDYSKDEPITEDKAPDFFELFYSRTKIYSEQGLVALSKKYPLLILRIRISLDDRPHPINLLTKLINYKKVITTPNSVTYIPDFIKALKHLLKINARGIYNIALKDPLNYPKFMRVYQKYVPDFKFETIEYKNMNLVRTNLVLSVKKLERTGFKVRSTSQILEECVKEYVRYSRQAQPGL